MSNSRSRPQRVHHDFSDARSQLFERSAPAGAFGVNTGFSSASAGTGGSTRLQSESDDRIAGLSGKVDILKQVTLQIGNTVREQNRMFCEMENDFSKTETVLSGTMRKLKGLVDSQSGYYLFYIMIFAVGIFMLTYFYLKLF